MTSSNIDLQNMTKNSNDEGMHYSRKPFIIALIHASEMLTKYKEEINKLNVFPVPDGDTGTNMTMTIMSAANEVSGLVDEDMATICKAISSGSLRGARGNSGVILSQLFRGMTKVMAKELSKEDIRVHILCPGGILTDMVAKANPALVNQPCILPEDIADIIEFILTHRTNAIIDQVNIHRYGKEPFQ